VRQARQQARRLGRTADFRIGDLAATGLGTHSADAVLCVDGIHFAPQPDAAYRELRRILAPGGRAVLTCWEPVDPDDEQVPRRLRLVGLGTGLMVGLRREGLPPAMWVLRHLDRRVSGYGVPPGTVRLERSRAGLVSCDH
jgi:SAM-dependent methyltransferase